MPPITDPQAIEHPTLRELAREAVWVAKLEDAVGALEDLIADLLEPLTDVDASLTSEDQAADEEEDPLQVALSVVASAHEEADAALEDRLANWLAEDPEHWPIFRLALLEAWRDERGSLNPAAPGWIRVFATNAALTHFQQDRYGRQREIDLDD